MSIAYLNGEWMPPEEARVSVLDRGFMFGDGVYEALPVYHGKPYFVREHLARLSRSLREVRIISPLTEAEWETLISEGVEKCDVQFATVYIQVTRGVASQRQHEYPESTPTVFLMVSEAPGLERLEIVPLSMVTLEDFRWARGDIKSVSLIASGLLRNEAMLQGADDAILIRDGFVTEATASNIFIVKDGAIATPPKSNFLLHGITREHIIDVAREGGLTVDERPVSMDELQRADEVFVTSTGHEAWPVGKLDGEIIGNGEGGVVWQQVDDLFQRMKADLRQG